MNMDISQGNCQARIYTRKAGDQRADPDPTRAFNTYCTVKKEPFSADKLFGEKWPNLESLEKRERESESGEKRQNGKRKELAKSSLNNNEAK